MSKFNMGQVVVLKSDKSTKGAIIGIIEAAPENRYQVFTASGLQTYYESQIETEEMQFGVENVSAERFHAGITASLIRNPSLSSLYSLNSAKIDFIPHQFRPVLKFIKSDRPRLLIADGVGVGKTIEAGLILKELQARRNLDSVLIICPRPLVSERKWEMEMERFGEDFTALDGNSFRHCINELNIEGEWPDKYKKAVIPYSLFDEANVFGNNAHPGLMGVEPPKFDLVIVDEYEIIGLNLKSQLNQGFRGLVLFLLTLKIADKAIHRRQYAQNRNLSAERGAAGLCSACTRHTLPTYISFRRPTELSACVDLHRVSLRHSTHVPVARAA